SSRSERLVANAGLGQAHRRRRSPARPGMIPYNRAASPLTVGTEFRPPIRCCTHIRLASQDARLRQTSRELREELALGREIESRVRAYLRGRFGARSVALVGF